MFDLRLDHIAISGESRDEARAYVEDALGLAMQAGGQHARFGTHNHLMGMQDGLYLEAISIDPEAPQPDRPRWFDLDRFSGAPRLTNWICSVNDIAAATEHWPKAGTPIALERGELRWQMAVPASGILPFDGLFPPLIEWAGSLHPAKMLEPKALTLVSLTIRHPAAEELESLLGPICGGTVRFETSQETSLIAEFDTPHGRRVLT